MRKDTKLSTLSILQAMKSWGGPGNKASKECKLLEKSSWTAEMCSQLWWYSTANSVMICNCNWQTSKQCKFNSNLQLLAGATCINIMTAAQWMILYRVDLSPYCATAYNSSPVQVFLDLTLTIIGKWYLLREAPLRRRLRPMMTHLSITPSEASYSASHSRDWLLGKQLGYHLVAILYQLEFKPCFQSFYISSFWLLAASVHEWRNKSYL